MSEFLPSATLRGAIDQWLAAGTRVAGPRGVAGRNGSAAPVQGSGRRIQYAWFDAAEQLVTQGHLRPVNSIKQFFLPPHETLFCFRGQGRQIELAPQELPSDSRVIVGARSCDAAALPLLDRVFNWDTADAVYNRRRELTTVVVLACRDYDPHCFCTSVGSGPADERGADAMLIPLDDDGFEVRFVTPKGERLLKPFTTDRQQTAPTLAGPPVRFELDQVQRFLDGGFADPLWDTAPLRCIGCGACAHNCPACHCFDIVDQPPGDGFGRRVRNWDSCQSRLYSLHASGHNPRSTQGQRQRNRLFHKFRTYPQKFGELLCTGCGACSRNCPVELGVLNLLEPLAQSAAHLPPNTQTQDPRPKTKDQRPKTKDQRPKT